MVLNGDFETVQLQIGRLEQINSSWGLSGGVADFGGGRIFMRQNCSNLYKSKTLASWKNLQN